MSCAYLYSRLPALFVISSPFIVPMNESNKGLNSSAAVLKKQAFYDGILSAQGIQKIQSYGQESLFDNNA